MSRNPPTGIQPISDLKLSQRTEHSVLLKSASTTVQISALTDDLFLLRATRGSKLLRNPSWAVVQKHWPAFTSETIVTDDQIRLQTAKGQLQFNLQTGAWSLEELAGRIALAAPAQPLHFHDQAPYAKLALRPGEKIFGLGETTGAFNKRGLIREFWNIDVLGHAPAIYPGLQKLYVSIPFALTWHEGSAAGLFWDNSERQVWDLGSSKPDEWQLKADGGDLVLYLFLGPSIGDIIRRYTELTGRMPLPPRWALGYQQCRYSYETRARVEEIAREFRQRQLPCDVLYLDIHHLDEYRVFTFGRTFPRPAEMVSRLADEGFKVVTIVDPGVKDTPAFPVLKRGLKARAFVKSADGKTDYVGKVWPGDSRFPDFLNARTRKWWGREQSQLSALGVAGFWNDMNEPANFLIPSKTLPVDCVHDTDHGRKTHAEVHNLYGFQMARASQEGALSTRPELRPFIITRAGYAGVQRHALVWTGDNSSNWDHLADSVQMLLNLGLSGVAFCGSDAGGFLDNTTPELLVRWMQLAAFTPFFRNHTNIGTIAQEPWAFGPEVESICRRYLNLRYQLLPYLYGLFAEAHQHGSPIMRPLAWEYQDEPDAVAAGDQFLLGSELLVAPILRQGATARSVYLPAGDWFDFRTGKRHRGGRHILALAPLAELPLYVRAGAMIPLGAVQQFVGEKPLETVNLHIWPGEQGHLNWIEDDGISQTYLQGNISEREITCDVGPQGGEIQFAPCTGKRETRIKHWRIILRCCPGKLSLLINGQPAAAQHDPASQICAFEFPNSSERISVICSPIDNAEE